MSIGLCQGQTRSWGIAFEHLEASMYLFCMWKIIPKLCEHWATSRTDLISRNCLWSSVRVSEASVYLFCMWKILPKLCEHWAASRTSLILRNCLQAFVRVLEASTHLFCMRRMSPKLCEHWAALRTLSIWGLYSPPCILHQSTWTGQVPSWHKHHCNSSLESVQSPSCYCSDTQTLSD